MSFKDLGKKDAAPHVDTPEQAEARAAAAELKAKHDAKAARHVHGEGKARHDPPKPTASNEPKDPATRK
jgi:hypothetical protein